MKLVIDTNIIFSALCKPNSRAGKVIFLAIEGRLELYAPETVKSELKRTLKNKLDYEKEESKETISSLPITWIEKEIYREYAEEFDLKDKNDRSVAACSLILNCALLTGDKDFDNVKKVKVTSLKDVALE
ncbi:MAG: putative toxin-antitoxin system toxin component, PIN family [Euryarchaeota archaeon]|nr:putative toxin-antitoxin system toxin component, PIN family [Euryarchaeota archaeon]